MSATGPSSAAFSDATRFAWLRLWRSENVGPRTFETLLRRYGSAEAALDGLPKLAARGRPIAIASREAVEREISEARRMGAVFLCRDEPAFPPLLREIDSPPAVIAVRGRVEVLARPAVAIVGSRNASAAGLAFAERLARSLGRAGYVIVSGFARGIDARAHRGALASGTVAVLAGGHDRLYPADQGPLMERLLEDGAAITEMPFGWEARGRDFPRRNRLVSGLSLATVVVEAARRSGSLITARFAAEQGRDVFAVPGSPLDPRSEGTNDLIREGATFCADPDDVLRTLADQHRRRDAGPPDRLADAPASEAASLWDELDLDDGPAGDAAERAIVAVPRLGASFLRAARPSVADRLAPDRFAPDLFAPDLFDSDLFAPDLFDSDERASDAAPAAAPLDRVAAALGPSPIGLDELTRALELPVREVRAALLELELAGRIERHGGGLVSLLTR